MRKASRLRDVMATLSISTRLLEVPAGGMHLHRARCMATTAPPPRHVAAAAGSSETPPPPPRQPRQPLHHPQHREQFEHIQQRWHVPRTELRHFPDDVQQRIRSSGRGSASVAAQAHTLAAGQPTSARRSAATAASEGGGRGAQAGLVAELEKLGAALEYERQAGFVNVVGSTVRVPVGEWASRQLLTAAGKLQDRDAIQACMAAARQLWRYADLAPAERAAPLAAAEAAAAAALVSVQVGSRQPEGRRMRYQPQPEAGQRQQQAQPASPQVQQQRPVQQVPPPPRQQQQQRPPQQQQRQQAQAVPPHSTALTAQAQQQAGGSSSSGRPLATPAAPAAPPVRAMPSATPPAVSLPTAPAAALEPVADHELDAAAEQAHEEEMGQAVPTPEGEEYVMSGNRRVKASTVAFRLSFAEAAAQAAAALERGAACDVAAAAGGEQRSAQWFKMREGRLTASAFSKALGLFASDRQQLWGEKVGMVQPFSGNEATAWGTSAEPRAQEAYQALTGQQITNCMFQVKHDDPVHSWLGASPDGIIEALSLDTPAAGAAAAAAGLPPGVWGSVAQGAGPLAGPGRGILEIKCPYNRGQPELAVPPKHATWYYMPQVQGLMYIFDCDWCNLFIWTPNGGSAVYHIRRDPAYWAKLWDVLAGFWWQHVVPARQDFQAGRWEEVEQYRPQPTIECTEEMRQWSKQMAVQAPVTFFRSQPPQQYQR